MLDPLGHFSRKVGSRSSLVPQPVNKERTGRHGGEQFALPDRDNGFLIALEVFHEGQRDLVVLELDPMQRHAPVVINDEHGLSPRQEPESAYSGDSDQTLSSEVFFNLIVALVPTKA